MSETILELERRLEFILQELQKVEEIDCPSLKQVTRNYLLTLFRRTLSLIIDVKRNETENNPDQQLRFVARFLINSLTSLIEWS